jgi:hypothetical protein
MKVIAAYRFALEPNRAQESALSSWQGPLRFLWNWMLQQRRDTYIGSEGLSLEPLMESGGPVWRAILDNWGYLAALYEERNSAKLNGELRRIRECVLKPIER